MSRLNLDFLIFCPPLRSGRTDFFLAFWLFVRRFAPGVRTFSCFLNLPSAALLRAYGLFLAFWAFRLPLRSGRTDFFLIILAFVRHFALGVRTFFLLFCFLSAAPLRAYGLFLAFLGFSSAASLRAYGLFLAFLGFSSAAPLRAYGLFLAFLAFCPPLRSGRTDFFLLFWAFRPPLRRLFYFNVGTSASFSKNSCRIIAVSPQITPSGCR